MSRSWWIVLLVLMVSCRHGNGIRARQFRMPLSAAEAPLVLPALAAAAEKLGYETRADQQSVSITTASGARFSWTAYNEFSLAISPPKGTSKDDPDALDATFRELKVKADEVWDLGIELRQKNAVGASMIVNPYPPPPATTHAPPPPPPAYGQGQGQVQFGGNASFGSQPAPQQQPSYGGATCRSSLDCGSGGWCKSWRGTQVCMNHGGQGAPCSSSIDCGSGLFCRGDTCG